LFTQAPLQTAWPAGQTQPPATHVCEAKHTVPQVPQLAESVCLFTQAPLQTAWPAGQTQPPATHVCEAKHTVPQVPQLSGLVCVSTHVLPHWV
jgi:hypothetical protein